MSIEKYCTKFEQVLKSFWKALKNIEQALKSIERHWQKEWQALKKHVKNKLENRCNALKSTEKYWTTIAKSLWKAINKNWKAWKSIVKYWNRHNYMGSEDGLRVVWPDHMEYRETLFIPRADHGQLRGARGRVYASLTWPSNRAATAQKLILCICEYFCITP